MVDDLIFPKLHLERPRIFIVGNTVFLYLYSLVFKKIPLIRTPIVGNIFVKHREHFKVWRLESGCRKHSVAHLLIIYLVVNPFQYIFLNSCTEYFFQFALLEADKFAFVLLLLRIVGSKGIKALEVQKVNDFSRIELYSTLVRERPKTEV